MKIMTRYDTDAIRAALPVAQVCEARGIELRQAGGEMRGDCPIVEHRSKGSFSTSGDLWKCHACNEGGDVISLLKVLDDMSDAQAIEKAATMAGVTTETELTEEQRTARQLRELARTRAKSRATSGAKGYWDACQKRQKPGEPGRDYLEGRGLGPAKGEVRYREGAICVALRDGTGQVTNVVRRWFASKDDKKVTGLKNCGTKGMFGDLTEAHLTTGPVVVVEGVADWLSARVLTKSAFVAGVHGAGRWPDVVRMVAKVAKVRGLVLVPHLTDMNKVGAKKVDEAIRAARELGVTTIRRFDIPAGDLNDFLLAGGQGADVLAAPIVEEPDKYYPQTDLGNAELFADVHRDGLRYVGERDMWLQWDGCKWERAQNAVHLVQAAKTAIQHMDGDHALDSQAAARIKAMVSLARAEPRLAVPVSALDADPMKLAVANGTLDLATGQMYTSRREDLLTVASPIAYDPDARAPRWEQFLAEVFEPAPDAIEFVRRYAGYSLTGDTSAQVLLFAHGGGANGKGTLFRAMQALLGNSLSAPLPFELFVDRTIKKVNEEYALSQCSQVRAVFVSEGKRGESFDNTIVNKLTGEDPVNAREPRGIPFSYRPSFKLWMTSNWLPSIPADDYAMWRRFVLVPFLASFRGDRRDDNLERTLAGELPGILAWAVRGCRDWIADGGGLKGLAISDSIRNATDAHQQDQDTIGEFLDDCCVLRERVPDVSCRVSTLYHRFDGWARAHGEEVKTMKQFGKEMKRRGLGSFARGGGKKWFPVGLQVEGE
jgi:P4 family phage/plasmid primase-like protien